jgi:hypothetical protein
MSGVYSIKWRQKDVFVCTGDVVPVRWKVVVERLAAAQCRVAPVAELLRRGHNLRLARLADVVSEVEDPGDVRPQAAHEAIAAGSAHRDLAVPTPAHIKTYISLGIQTEAGRPILSMFRGKNGWIRAKTAGNLNIGVLATAFAIF